MRHYQQQCSSIKLTRDRYINMDYIFISSLAQNAPQCVIVSYDIACQWSKNLHTRVDTYPPHLTLDNHRLCFLVPKWHLAAHRVECRTRFSFNFTPWVGRTDGEAPERGWAAANGLATSTKGMGPGFRRDTLDDHFGDYNWRKVVSMSKSSAIYHKC